MSVDHDRVTAPSPRHYSDLEDDTHEAHALVRALTIMSDWGTEHGLDKEDCRALATVVELLGKACLRISTDCEAWWKAGAFSQGGA